MDWLRLAALVMVVSVGCSDDVPATGGSGSGSGSGSDTGSSTASPVSMTVTSTPSTTVEPSSSGTTLDPDSGTSAGETCVEGLWTGIFYYGFETSAFMPCEGEPPGDWWWNDGPSTVCEASLVTVTGTVCGPGTYGHLGGYPYEFTGNLVGDPCLPAECGVEPEMCAPFEPLCAAECSLVDQDCIDGEKCVPTSPDRIPPWTQTVCVPLQPGPGMGEPCMREWMYDDCDEGQWCIPDTPGSNMGVCVELCTAETTCTEGECVACETSEFVAFGVCVPPECMGMPGCPGVC